MQPEPRQVGPHSLSSLLPCPGRTRSSLLSKDLPSPSARLSWWVQVVPPGSHSPFAPISPDSGPSFCRAAPRAPQSAGGHTCPDLAASPCSQLPGMGSAQVVRAHERRRKGVSLWSASSCDLGPPSLYLSLPATYGSFPLRSCPATPPAPSPNYKCSCSSAVDQSHQGRGQNAESWAPFPKI